MPHSFTEFFTNGNGEIHYTKHPLQVLILQGVLSGAEGSRTLDLCSAIAALSQLSYRPDVLHILGRRRGAIKTDGATQPLAA
jgi:hypothetical protein